MCINLLTVILLYCRLSLHIFFNAKKLETFTRIFIFRHFSHNPQKSRINPVKNVKNTNAQKKFVNLVIFFYSYYVDITSKKVYY